MAFEEGLLWLFVIFTGIAVDGGLYDKWFTLRDWFNPSSESGLPLNTEPVWVPTLGGDSGCRSR
ncbi:hypothetical protein MPNT_320024 [Candidatus Methylacidithermus pantelleriae]|uniref:Uncharacterized protein n=2 Tax=Candidatus Methylacidithermus pantelleriae TaxID=2744239 RepID=A0A8J2BQS5_9BACT|nr:hypothetical protein MPNT_320024 [Candidatus Methylacidithermus pantelleriae]